MGKITMLLGAAWCLLKSEAVAASFAGRAASTGCVEQVSKVGELICAEIGT
jgi:hypothetical protein